MFQNYIYSCKEDIKSKFGVDHLSVMTLWRHDDAVMTKNKSRKLSDIIVRELNLLIDNFVKWVKSNGLAVNLKKQNAWFFSRSRNVDLPMPLIIANAVI